MTENATSESSVGDSKARKVRGKFASQQLNRLALANTAAGTASLDSYGSFIVVDGSGVPTDQVVFTVTLSNRFGLRMFGTPHFSLYLTSVSDSNDIPSGSNVDSDDWYIDARLDWGATDNDNIVYRVYVRNLSASPHDVLIRVNWRYMLESE